MIYSYKNEESDIASYADDTTSYTCENNMNTVIVKLEYASLLINWINNNFIKVNPDKFHVILSEKDETLSVNVENYKIYNRGLINY